MNVFMVRELWKDVNLLMNFFKKLFCCHRYALTNQEMIAGGMRKALYFRCKRCGKTKVEIL
jgi:hypothetical protein